MHDTWWYIWNFLAGILGGVVVLVLLKVFVFFCKKFSDYKKHKHYDAFWVKCDIKEKWISALFFNCIVSGTTAKKALLVIEVKHPEEAPSLLQTV
jgi:hypothetical protein